MTVELSSNDYNLWRWRDLARYLGVTPEWYQILNQSGGGFADKWFVYCNEAIPPSSIIKIDYLHDAKEAGRRYEVGRLWGN